MPPLYSHVVELLGLCSETNHGFPEALPIGQLSKGHAEVLIQATQGFDLVVSVVGLYAAAKNLHWYVFHHLRENELACIHDLPQRSRKIPRV
jgi:hypothetical protein